MGQPSSLNIKFKFPEFTNVPDATVEFAIEEAMINCGQFGDASEWIDDANQTLAIMYYTAHLMMVSIMRAQSGGVGQVISSERTPELSISYAVPKMPDMSEPIDLTMTIYGVRFVQLVKKNFPAVGVVNSAVGW